jgi:uncharacterized membrane protein (DUF2068 family)
MNPDRQREHTLQVIAESERLIAEADAAQARYDQLLASRGLTREAVARRLEQLGPQAREHAQREVEKALKQAQEAGEQAVAHAQFAGLPAQRSRRLRHRV